MNPQGLQNKTPNPNLRERGKSTFDLVEEMYYLYVRVVKARNLPTNSLTGSCDPYAEVKLGNYKGATQLFEKRCNPEWKQVFAFSKDKIQSSILEVFVRDKAMVGRDDYVGKVRFDMNEVPTRVPPDSPLAPQWYMLEDRNGDPKKGEIMVAVWMGTQGDDAFPEAWHSDSASVHGEGILNVRSKVYVSPKLWYLRVNVIESQDLVMWDDSRNRKQIPPVSAFVRAQVGDQVFKTKVSATQFWNEDLIFVVAEPFEEKLVVTVESKTSSSKEVVLGRVIMSFHVIERRFDHHRMVSARWFDLSCFGFREPEVNEKRKEVALFASRIHLRVCLEGAYHVVDEPTLYLSDQRPTARQLWNQPVGTLKVGVLGARGLVQMKKTADRKTTNAYCVARYGHKWVRTRTVVESSNPRWNEQYTWEVYDPCTVITLGVFDNCHLGGPTTGPDLKFGKIRIRLSTLEMNRTHNHFFPLQILQPSGLKKMGELHLAVRFTPLSITSLILLYPHPLLPKIHYLIPFTVTQIDILRNHAMDIVTSRLDRAEPPLRREVVRYMLDTDSLTWSMRRSRANFLRIIGLFSGAVSLAKWFDSVQKWENPATTVLVHLLFVIVLCHPDLVLPTVFLYMFLIGVWNYRFRPRGACETDTKLSCLDALDADELDEELDTFPTSRAPYVVQMRYDRLRGMAGRLQGVMGDFATQGERLGGVLGWRDPRASGLFVVFCLGASVVFYVTPFRAVGLVGGMYWLRHPRFRSKMPSVAANFLRRMPSRADCML